MEPIKGFFGDYRWLSNFHLQYIEYEGIIYPSNEHAFQATKTLDTEDRKSRFVNCSCSEVKRRGRSLVIRPDWEDIKIQVMSDINVLKFHNQELLKKLLATDDAYLEETNYWHDSYWGVCTCTKCGGEGKNVLGRILMGLRDKLREKTI
jgi:ribA/ribD-fused uncharacterized protein